MKGKNILFVNLILYKISKLYNIKRDKLLKINGSHSIAQNKIRIVTAASLFDGHDAAINIMRRIIQSTGCEVIHLGHDRSVEEVVNCAIQEDVQAIAMTSYQGGHNEYFRYMYDLLQEKGANNIKIFGGGVERYYLKKLNL